MAGLGNWAYNSVKKVPITPLQSDVIPQIDTLCNRFMANEFPYKIITFKDYYMHPTYMPMQWMPYCIPILIKMDNRLFAYILFALAILFLNYFSFPQLQTKKNLLYFFIGSLALNIICVLIIYNNIIDTTVEQGIAAFYLLLPILIIKKNYGYATLLISICLLSRYSIVLWVPLYLFILFSDNKKLAFSHLFFIALTIVVVYIYPFLSVDTNIFFNGYNYHTQAALGEWGHLNLLTNMPFHLFNGQGLGFLFFKLPIQDLQTRLAILQKTQLIICTIFLIFCSYYYLKNKNTLNKEKFLIASLVIYIILFYSFIQIPYKYLFLVPCTLIVSSYLAFLYANTKSKIK